MYWLTSSDSKEPSDLTDTATDTDGFSKSVSESFCNLSQNLDNDEDSEVRVVYRLPFYFYALN